MNRIFLLLLFLKGIFSSTEYRNRNVGPDKTTLDALIFNSQVYSIMGGNSQILNSVHDIFPNIVLT